MSDIDLGDDDGFVTITMGGDSVSLDLFLAQSRLMDHHARNEKKSNEEYITGLVQIVQDLGFPRPSHRLAIRFMEAIYAACAEQKKSTGSPAESPDSTASTPAA